MPIIISRTGSIEPRETRPLTQEQKEVMWEKIVISWTEKNSEKFRDMLELTDTEKEYR